MIVKGEQGAYASRLKMILDANRATDWRTVVLDGTQPGTSANLFGLDAAIDLPLLKAYQRILRILPPGEDQRAIPLLESGLHSAIQIAGMPQPHFEGHWASLFPGEEALGVRVYRAALKRRSELLHRHVNDIQRNEPHYRAARFK